MSVSAETCARWYWSVSDFGRTTYGLIAICGTLGPSDTDSRAVVLNGTRHTRLGPSPTRMGRKQDNDIVLGGGGLSPLHCLIERRGVHDWLHDVESAHGTFEAEA